MTPLSELQAPQAWRAVDFISDLHLSEDQPATFAAWREYLSSTTADAVFILGDLFEVWVGDDSLPAHEAPADSQDLPASFISACAQTLSQTGARLALYFMPGNRDFLVGQALMTASHATLLDDPTLLILHQQRWLLSHGDALCLDDTAYLEFRRQVRGTQWQHHFLQKPLAERQLLARQLREQSHQAQVRRQQSGAGYADVDTQAARQALIAARSSTLIHGHTHRPADHDLGSGLRRVVLSDWDLDAPQPRAEVLRLQDGQLRRIPVPLA